MLEDEYLEDVWKQLGMLTTGWAQYELELFWLFCDVTRLDEARGRIIWFNMTSLKMKIDITERLLDAGAPLKKVEEMRAALETARKLCKRRNRYVHGTYMLAQGKSGLVLRALRELDYETTETPVRPKEIGAFVGEVQEAMGCLIDLRQARERDRARLRSKYERQRGPKLVETEPDDETKR